jgi:hypothetical protein
MKILNIAMANSNYYPKDTQIFKNPTLGYNLIMSIGHIHANRFSSSFLYQLFFPSPLYVEIIYENIQSGERIYIYKDVTNNRNTTII